MLSIAVVILIMAFINFVNFFFALIPIRLRTVNVSKVFGASVGELRWSFLFEAIGLVMCAILLTAYIAIAFIDFPLNGYVTSSLNPFENLPALGIILTVGSGSGNLSLVVYHFVQPFSGGQRPICWLTERSCVTHGVNLRAVYSIDYTYHHNTLLCPAVSLYD